MAIASRVVVLFESAANVFAPSSGLELIFKSVSVSVDGVDNGMNITEVSGEFDFNAKNVTNIGTVDGVDISAHAARHISAGADEIDGDQLDIDFTPSAYTPSVTPAEATSVDHLTAHLAGIDDAVAAATAARVIIDANLDSIETDVVDAEQDIDDLKAITGAAWTSTVGLTSGTSNITKIKLQHFDILLPLLVIRDQNR